MEALEDLYFALHPFLVPLDLLRDGLQRDIAHDVGRLGGVITRGRVAEEDANDTIASGREKFHVHWAVDALPMVHLSLFNFFASLLVYLFNIDHMVVCWVALLTTFMPCIRRFPQQFGPFQPLFRMLSSKFPR